jgi:hypothetical protein
MARCTWSSLTSCYTSEPQKFNLKEIYLQSFIQITELCRSASFHSNFTLHSVCTAGRSDSKRLYIRVSETLQICTLLKRIKVARCYGEKPKHILFSSSDSIYIVPQALIVTVMSVNFFRESYCPDYPYS